MLARNTPLGPLQACSVHLLCAQSTAVTRYTQLSFRVPVGPVPELLRAGGGRLLLFCRGLGLSCVPVTEREGLGHFYDETREQEPPR